MTILKEGKLKGPKTPVDTLWFGKCKKCKTELQFHESEGTRRPSDENPNQERTYITCPICGNQIKASRKVKDAPATNNVTPQEWGEKFEQMGQKEPETVTEGA